MSDKKCFLVYGGESTGTRLVTSILVDCGFYGDKRHQQRLDYLMDSPHEKVEQIRHLLSCYPGFVWRRSFPHQRVFPSVGVDLAMLVPMYFEYSDVKVIVTVRNWLAASRSQVHANHVQNIAQAMANLQTGYIKIFEFLSKYQKDVRYHIVSYDCLLSSGFVYLPYLLNELGITRDKNLDGVLYKTIKNENNKHFWEYLRIHRLDSLMDSSNVKNE